MICPGMFDEYLSEEPERGSDMVSNAQLQYQAVMGIQSARKVSNNMHILIVLLISPFSFVLFGV
jgi:hypothetical protein